MIVVVVVDMTEIVAVVVDMIEIVVHAEMIDHAKSVHAKNAPEKSVQVMTEDSKIKLIIP
jgi:hypothetical protein